MKSIIAFVIILIFGIISINENNYSAVNNSTQDSAMVCPVSKEKIEEGAGVKYSYLKENFTFCCEGCLKAFKKEPASYMTELTCPVCDDEDAVKTIASVNDNVKYYFCNQSCKKKFEKNADKYLNNYKNQ